MYIEQEVNPAWNWFSIAYLVHVSNLLAFQVGVLVVVTCRVLHAVVMVMKVNSQQSDCCLHEHGCLKMLCNCMLYLEN